MNTKDMNGLRELSNAVRSELLALRDCGVRVSNRALVAAEDLDQLSEYVNLRVGEIADLLTELN